MGPLISPEAKVRVESLIQSGVDEGAKLLLDGRNVQVKGYENGNFVGPTILGNVTVRFDKRYNDQFTCRTFRKMSYNKLSLDTSHVEEVLTTPPKS